MKTRRLSIVALCLLVLVNVFALVACDSTCEHEWGDWTLSTESTCLVQGTKQRKCLKCEEVQTDNLDIADHSYDVDNIVWTWNADGSVVATLYCDNDATHTKQINASVGEEQELEYKSGSGYFACNGSMIPIYWSRDAATDPFCFTDAEGNPITLSVGKTYIAVVYNGAPVTAE